MDLMNEFKAVSKEFIEFRQMLEDAKSDPMDHDLRAYLEDITKALDQQFADMQKTFPAAVDAVKKVNAEAQATNEEATQKLAAVHAQMAAMEKEAVAAAKEVAPVVAAAAPAAVVIDTALGGRLRNELLSQFGLKTPAAPAPAVDPGSVWQMSSEFGDEPAPRSPRPAKPSKPAPPAKPQKGARPSEGSEAWEGLSELEDE